MNSRRVFDGRDIREFGACILVFVVFFPLVFTEMPLMARLGSMVSSVAAVFIGSVLWHGRCRHRVLPELSVHEFLAAEIDHLDYQIRLLRSVSWWYLAPLAVGFLMFIWGLWPTPTALAASAVYYIIDRTIYYLNQWAIINDLQPQRETLEIVYQSLNEVAEANIDYESR